MTPGTLNLALYRGDTYDWTFTLWQDAAKTVPYDLTGATGKAEIRSAAAGTLITSMTIDIEAPNVVNATLTAANSKLLAKTGGVWDLQITDADGSVQTLLAGSVTVTIDVTDSATSGGLLLVQDEPEPAVVRMGRPV